MSVVDRDGIRIGAVKSLLLDPSTGAIVAVNVACWSRFHTKRHVYRVPWPCLAYDPSISGFKATISASALDDAPLLIGDEAVWPERHCRNPRESWDDPLHWTGL